jgi:hypothetical protein
MAPDGATPAAPEHGAGSMSPTELVVRRLGAIARGMLGSVGEMKRRMLAGEWYHASDPELAFERKRCAVLVEQYNATNATEVSRRAELLGQLLGACGWAAE